MNVIGRKVLEEAGRKHGDLAKSLDAWLRITQAAQWQNLMEVRRSLPTADAVGEFTVFNVRGNRYRLIAEIHYETKTVFIDRVLTHAEYDRERWKE